MNAEVPTKAPPSRFRIRASAAIVRDGKILLVEYDDDLNGYHFNLPGGGVKPGESVLAAVRREVREETAAEVDVGPLLLAWEFRPDWTDTNLPNIHVIGLVFRCALRDGSEPRLPPPPDLYQTGVRWVPLSDLPGVPLLPHIAGQLIEALESPVLFDRFVVEPWPPVEH
ncbi:MAG TPA: NUDIX domain-containing protein [Aggregatilineales bacterium]|nr:NUDIX domain-containing protein [Aggregatilineales bacterium]